MSQLVLAGSVGSAGHTAACEQRLPGLQVIDEWLDRAIAAFACGAGYSGHQAKSPCSSVWISLNQPWVCVPSIRP
jgi:hypothetical protein